MKDDLASLRQQLVQLQSLFETGAVGAEAYERGKATLERRVVDLVVGGAAVESPVPMPVSAPAPRPSAKLAAMLCALVVVVAAAGYAWTGSPNYDSQAAATQALPAAEGADQAAQVNAMVDKLAARLKDKPDDAKGWAMLGRSYTMLGRHDDAVAAYQKAVALQGEDAKLLADYADALAMKNGRNLQGEPTRLIERALAIDPNHVKALALAGSAAFDRQDFAAAVRHWEKLVQLSPSDAEFVRQVQTGISEARTLGKLPQSAAAPRAVPAAAPAVAVTPAVTSAAAPAASVSGTVTLAAALAAQAKPTDTVFIFARAAQGPRMPLVIVRKQVKDLPFEFSLDDSMAMSPAAKLSSFASVVITARVTKSGQAMPEAGDLVGQSEAVSLGASGVKVQIAEIVKMP